MATPGQAQDTATASPPPDLAVASAPSAAASGLGADLAPMPGGSSLPQLLSKPEPGGPLPADAPESARALRAECAWTGIRVMILLARDDVDTAAGVLTFYDRFACPGSWLADAFACLARSPVAMFAARADGQTLTDVASACWVDPTTPARTEATPADGQAAAPEPPVEGATPSPAGEGPAPQ